jgi:hypothetical protein
MNIDRIDIRDKLAERILPEGRPAIAWVSRGDVDPCWDRFLQETSLGQFQQSAMWARVKALEGWNALRLMVTLDQRVVAGFQILWRSSWHVRIGYVSKGPVVLQGFLGLAEFTTELLRRLAWSEKLRAIIVQPPDLCKQLPETLADQSFQLSLVGSVNSSTWMIDATKEFTEVEQGISKWTRKKIKQSKNRGVTIREGRREDVSTFFELMVSTCNRQNTKPVPANVQTLLALWDVLHPEGGIRLTLAESQGKPLAGLACIIFGQTVSFWKKGWTSSDGDKHPNELLMHEMLQWVCSNEYHNCDFCAFDRDMAIAILNGTPLTADQERSRHVFNVRLGGEPKLLPEAQIYFPNPVLRLVYGLVFRSKIRRAEKRAQLNNHRSNVKT